MEILGDVLKTNPHGDALRQANPVEGRLDRGNHITGAFCIGEVRRIDRVSETLNFTFQAPLAMPHQRDNHGIAGLDVPQLSLLKISIHAE